MISQASEGFREYTAGTRELSGAMPGSPLGMDMSKLIENIEQIVDELITENAKLRAELEQIDNANHMMDRDRTNRLDSIINRYREYRSPKNKLPR